MNNEKFSKLYSIIMAVMLIGGAFLAWFSLFFLDKPVGSWLFFIGFFTMLLSPFPAIIELSTRGKR